MATADTGRTAAISGTQEYDSPAHRTLALWQAFRCDLRNDCPPRTEFFLDTGATNLDILDKIAKAGATFKSLGDAWADTTTSHGRLMLTVLGGLAEFERELIRVRTGEGRVRAKAHSITSSAMAISPGEGVRLSALAALRLRTNSKVVDCTNRLNLRGDDRADLLLSHPAHLT